MITTVKLLHYGWVLLTFDNDLDGVDSRLTESIFADTLIDASVCVGDAGEVESLLVRGGQAGGQLGAL